MSKNEEEVVMPLSESKLQKQFEKTIQSALDKEFSGTKDADPSTNKKLAAAIATIAKDIVLALQTEAQVAPGQIVATAGGPSAQAGATMSPGSIL